uniref:BHLH domain-containing protein n=1 Tax=Macrostomum lignano TaxID=282301 RepID=A0A1I8JK96_9PLAT
MTIDASRIPVYRRPSRRQLMKTLRKLKNMLPPVSSNSEPGGDTTEDVADFLERLVDFCVSPDCAMAPESALQEQRQPDSQDSESAVPQADELTCVSSAAVSDLTELLCDLGPVRLG